MRIAQLPNIHAARAWPTKLRREIVASIKFGNVARIKF
jgi:hypothetical protein